MRCLCLLVGLFLVQAVLHAQQFGGNPASIRWSQINTDTVRIIFPRGMDDRAQRISTIIHAMQQNRLASLGSRGRKLDIVLHDQTLLSNAYVGLAPYRSEFYLTPPQDPFRLGATNWADQLAVHEYRHAQQYSNFNKGLSRVASVLLGEEGQAVANAAAVPDWFFEGDAVYNETRLTTQGRGVLPLFLSSYRSLYDAGRQYPYQKMRNGSLRAYVPDHYDLGYLLVAYGRKQYGDSLWAKVTDDAVRFRPLFYPFQGAVKKYTGVPFGRFVQDAMLFYQQQWGRADKDPDWMTPLENNNVNDYNCPVALPDGSVLVLKSSYTKVPGFYRVSAGGKEQPIAVRDITVDNYFSYRNGRIIYATYQPDARWGYREFTRIKTIDITTGKEETIFSRTKLFSPDITADHQRIAAVQVNAFMRQELVVLDRNGHTLEAVHEKGEYYTHPKFSADGRYVYAAVRNDNGEMALCRFGGGARQWLIPYGAYRIGYLQVQGDTLLFTMSHNGRDEIWAVKSGTDNSKRYLMASYRNGLYQAGVLPGGKLVAAAFTADGYRLALMQPLWQETAATGGNTEQPLYLEGLYPTHDRQLLQRIPEGKYAVSNYAGPNRLFRLHSWRPYFEDPEFSFTVYGQNILNTVQTEFGYTYNTNENSSMLSARGIFGGSYIQPLLGVSHTWQRSAWINRDTAVNWNELSAYGGVQLPLNLSGGRQYRYLTLGSTFHINKVSWTGLAQKLLRDREVNYLTFRASYTGQVQKARQQIYPHWAQSLLLQYRSSVNSFTARQLLGAATIYLPGLVNSHSLVLTAAYQGRDTTGQYLFSNDFPFARGYREVDFPRMWKFGVNYHLPLAYPDWGLGQVVYFLRVRANVFYDHGTGKSLRTGTNYPFHTAGAELFFDTRWWNQQPVTLGIRYNHLLNPEYRGTPRTSVWEVVLPVGLF